MDVPWPVSLSVFPKEMKILKPAAKKRNGRLSGRGGRGGKEKTGCLLPLNRRLKAKCN